VPSFPRANCIRKRLLFRLPNWVYCCGSPGGEKELSVSIYRFHFRCSLYGFLSCPTCSTFPISSCLVSCAALCYQDLACLSPAACNKRAKCTIYFFAAATSLLPLISSLSILQRPGFLQIRAHRIAMQSIIKQNHRGRTTRRHGARSVNGERLK
jgi:hypothetical protein